MRAPWLLTLAAAGAILAGCHDETAPRDLTPPAAPRGLYSVTGDHQVSLRWLANTEADVAVYRIYQAPCAAGGGCPYDRVGSTTGTSFQLGGLANGVTRFFAVAAVDRAGNESDLSYETVFDTPRPEGFGAVLASFTAAPADAGWDFSAQSVRDYRDPLCDVFYGYNGSVFQMFARDFSTDIQDAGFASSLDAVDFAPSDGWSPTGTVELIPGHCYVVWTRDDHYAKFRATGFINPTVPPALVRFDWAYQVDPGNRELRARRAGDETPVSRPIAWLR